MHAPVLRCVRSVPPAPHIIARINLNLSLVLFVASGKHPNIVKMLVDRGCDVNQADLEGTGPLHCAVMIKSLDTCKLLVAAGAEPKAKDKLGRTPFDLAKEFGFLEVMNYLKTM